MEPSRIPKVVFGLSLFWGLIGSVFFLDKGFYWPPIVLVPVGFLLILWIAEMRSNEFRAEMLKKVNYNTTLKLPISDFKAFASTERGVFTSIGPVPFIAPKFASNKDFAFELLHPHFVESLKAKGIPSDYIKSFLQNPNIKPGYKHLFIEICKVFLAEQNVHLPAGFKGRHENTSLISHSLIVCHLAAMEAKKYKYDVFNFTKKDSSFQVDPLDPLIPIIAMAHDIGKILTFDRDEKGDIQGYSSYHTNMGARIVVQLPGYWSVDLSNEDRQIIQTVIAFYHTPEKTPGEKIIDNGVTQQIKRVSSDRLHAIMDIVIKADNAALLVAKGQSYEQASLVVSSLESELKRGDIRPLKSVLYQFFSSPKFHVNSRSGQRSVAFKYCIPELTNGKNYLFFDSKQFSDAFIEHWMTLVESSSEKKYIESLNAYNGNKINGCTRIIMGHLLDEGRLVNLFPTGTETSKNEVEGRLYKVVFSDPKTKKESMTLSSMFVMNIDGLVGLEQFVEMNNNHSIPYSITPTIARPGKNGKFGHDLIEKDALENLTGEKIDDKSVLDLLPKPKLITKEEFKRLIESWINPNKENQELAPGITIAAYSKSDNMVVLLANSKRILSLEGIGLNSTLEFLMPYGFKDKIKVSKIKKNQFVLALDKSIFSTQALKYIDSKFPNQSI